MPALIWSTLIVVSTWPLMLAVQKRLWGKRSLAVIVMTIALLLIVIVPLALAVMTIIENADEVGERMKTLAHASVPAPPDWVEKIPLVGRKLAADWQAIAALSPDDLHARVAPYAKDAARWILGKAGSLAAFFLHLLLTVIISVLLYATGEAAADGVRAFARRLSGPRGEQSVTLAGQAIRAVALGVVVTAVVQAVLGGIGLAVAGVPLAGLLTVLMFVLAVAQIGAGPVLILAVIWLYWTGDSLTATVFLVWSLFVGSIDNVLRPILIKSGADLPLVLIFCRRHRRPASRSAWSGFSSVRSCWRSPIPSSATGLTTPGRVTDTPTRLRERAGRPHSTMRVCCTQAGVLRVFMTTDCT